MNPLENWKFEAVCGSGLAEGQATPTPSMSDKNRLILIGKVSENERKILSRAFTRHDDGGLIQSHATSFHLPEKVVEIDLADAANLESLADLDTQILARERSKADPDAFKSWSICGCVRGEPDRKVRLILKNNATFRLEM